MSIWIYAVSRMYYGKNEFRLTLKNNARNTRLRDALRKRLQPPRGFHSSASSPQILLLLLVPIIDIMTFVPFLTGTSVISVFPSALRIGQARGMITSFPVLCRISLEYRVEAGGIKDLPARNCVPLRKDSYSLAADSVEVGQLHEVVVRDVAVWVA